MEQIKKNWLGWVITFLIAFFTVILTNSFGEKSKDKYDLKEKVDNIEIKKADRIELFRHEEYDNKRFDEIKNDYKMGLSDLKCEFRDMRKDVIDILKKNK